MLKATTLRRYTRQAAVATIAGCDHQLDTHKAPSMPRYSNTNVRCKFKTETTIEIQPKRRSELYTNPSIAIMASINEISTHHSLNLNRSTYNDDHCLLFRLPLEIREEIYSYIAQSRIFRGPVSVIPVAFLSPIGGSTEQHAVLTTTTGLSCTCTRTRREFSKALYANATRIMVHIVDFDFSAFIAFHKSWSYRERRKYPIHDVHDTHVRYRSTADPYDFQAMRSGWIVFIHWNNSSAGHCCVDKQHSTCDDC